MTYMIMRTGKISKPQLKRVYFIMNGRSINWFCEECLEFLHQGNWTKLQCLQYPSQINVDNLINIRHETRRCFISKGQEYLQGKINELAKNSESKNIRDLYRSIHEF